MSSHAQIKMAEHVLKCSNNSHYCLENDYNYTEIQVKTTHRLNFMCQNFYKLLKNLKSTFKKIYTYPRPTRTRPRPQ